MKIFNWVHRKFHAKDERKTEPMTTHNEMEKEILLQHVALDNMFDTLGDGILTIGTFGFGPITNFNSSSEIEVVEDQNYEAKEKLEVVNKTSGLIECDEEKEEISTLLFSTYESELNVDVGSEIELVEMGNLDLINNEIVSDSQVGVVLKDEKLKDTKERTTLAELFLAESDEDVKNKQGSGKLKKKAKSKGIDYADVKKKSSNSFAKKLKLGSAGDSETHPIKKVQRLMKKMIKKKIHPSVEEKIPKNNDESVSLLQMEVAAA